MCELQSVQLRVDASDLAWGSLAILESVCRGQGFLLCHYRHHAELGICIGRSSRRDSVCGVLQSCGFRVSSQARGFFGNDVVSYHMEKGFAAGIGTNGMWRGVSGGKFIECLYNILKAHASWLTGIEGVDGHSQDAGLLRVGR